VTLPDENGGHTRAPKLFRGGQNTQFVVHEYVMFGCVALLDIVQFLLLVRVNQHAPGDRIVQS
jgi:hypothetical protein